MNKKVTKNMSKNEPPNLITTMDMKFIKTRMPEEGNNVSWQKYGKRQQNVSSVSNDQ